jgi:hypothetical protein
VGSDASSSARTLSLASPVEAAAAPGGVRGEGWETPEAELVPDRGRRWRFVALMAALLAVLVVILVVALPGRQPPDPRPQPPLAEEQGPGDPSAADPQANSVGEGPLLAVADPSASSDPTATDRGGSTAEGTQGHLQPSGDGSGGEALALVPNPDAPPVDAEAVPVDPEAVPVDPEAVPADPEAVAADPEQVAAGDPDGTGTQGDPSRVPTNLGPGEGAVGPDLGAQGTGRQVRVRITSHPSNARVYLGETQIGRTPLDMTLEVGEERLVLIVAKRGHRSRSIAVDSSLAEFVSDVELEPRTPFGRLRILGGE